MKIVCIGLAILVSALAIQIAAVSPAQADEITVTSNTTDTLGASASGNDATFNSTVLGDLQTVSLSQAYEDAGITSSSFVPVLSNVNGTYTAPVTTWPVSTTGYPAATVNFAGSVSGSPYGAGPAGFFEDTFVLPAGATGISLSGVGNVDDGGTVFLNGQMITTFDALSEFANAGFSDSNQSDFVIGGVNTLVIADDNFGGGPSGAAFYANISYGVPEPCTMLFLGLGLMGVAGIRRKLRN